MPVPSVSRRTRAMGRFVALATLLLLPGCAASTAVRDGAPPRRSSLVLSEAELAQVVTVGNLYDAIERLRSAWLRRRGGRSGYPVVFVDGTRFGEIESLRSLQVGHVASAHLMSAGDATTLFGTGYPAGIIDVRTRR